MFALFVKLVPPSAAAALGLAGAVAVSADPGRAADLAEYRRSVADIDEAARLLKGVREALDRIRKEPPPP